MAYVGAKIVKYSLKDLIDYTTDRKHDYRKILFNEPLKQTEEEAHIYADHCTVETAHIEWARTIKQAAYKLDEKSSRQRLGYHLYQSFEKGSVTADEAFELGKEFAERLFGGQYAYVVSTHVDKEHIHNHIAVCSVSYKTHKKLIYRQSKNRAITLEEWRKVSDEICREHGLDLIQSQEQNFYTDTKARNRKKTARSGIKQDIDKLIMQADTWEEFLTKLHDNLGYSIKTGEKYTSFKSPEMKRFARLTSLGEDYTEEAIKERLITKRPHIPKRIRNKETVKIALLIDMENNIKVKSSKGYETWAKVHNLQEASKTLNFLLDNNIGTYEELNDRVSSYKHKQQSAEDKVAELNKELYEMKQNIELVTRFKEVKKIAKGLDKAKNKTQYRTKYFDELMEHQALRAQMLLRYERIPDVDAMKREYNAKIKERNAVFEAANATEYENFVRAKQNIDDFLDYNKADNTDKEREMPQKYVRHERQERHRNKSKSEYLR